MMEPNTKKRSTSVDVNWLYENATDAVYTDWLNMTTKEIDKYVYEKIKDDMFPFLCTAVRKQRQVVVVGVFREHFEEYYSQKGWKIKYSNDVRCRERAKKTIQLSSGEKKPKLYDTERPMCYQMKDESEKTFYVIRTVPGADYLRHIAQMVWYTLQQLAGRHEKPFSEDLFKVWSYERANTTITEWTGLKEVLAGRAKGAVVVLGYVRFLHSYLAQQRGELEYVGEQTLEEPGSVYGCSVFRQNGGTIVFLGVRYTFWGSVSYHLAKKLYELGASTILYCDNTESLLHPDDTSDSVHLPANFYFSNGIIKLNEVGVENCLGSLFLENAVKNAHITHPCLLDVTDIQRWIWAHGATIGIY